MNLETLLFSSPLQMSKEAECDLPTITQHISHRADQSGAPQVLAWDPLVRSGWVPEKAAGTEYQR